MYSLLGWFKLFLRTSAIVFLWILFPLTAHTTSITVSGPVSGSWSYDTILVQGNINVPEGTQLTISPGTLVQFQSWYRFDVQGSLLAQGNPGDSIIITVIDTAGFSNQQHGRGGWSGIRLRSLAPSEDSSIFSYCSFRFGKATGDSLNCYGGAILVENFNKVRISNCLFFNNYSFYSGGAVYLQNSNTKIKNCRFTSNISGNTGVVYGYGGGICALNSAPVIKMCKFYNNISTGVGGACSFDNSDPVFENNIMQFNSSALGGAIGILRSSPNYTFSNNLISQNHALFFGGGVCCIRSFPVFSNLTIADNSSAYGGGFYCNDSAAPSIYNSIIWGNSGIGISAYIWDLNSSPNFYYCDIEGDTTGFEGSGSQMGYTGQYENNINLSPEFLGTGMFPYQLSPLSPCIDSGTPDVSFLNLPPTDLLGEARITNNCIDQGVYETNSSTSVRFIDLGETLLCFPNPFTQSTIIVFPSNESNIKEVNIYDCNGRLINQLRNDQLESNYSWDGTDEQGNQTLPGLYVIKANSSTALYTSKLIKY